jgi:hypothetical protein
MVDREGGRTEKVGARDGVARNRLDGGNLD